MKVIIEKDNKMLLEEWNSNTKPIMKCGHTANATTTIDNETIHCCVICAGMTKENIILQDKQPDLKNRKAKCDYCKKTAKSNANLPFFEHKPEQKYDSYYCGCFGWD
jgi:hypothetical protein